MDETAGVAGTSVATPRRPDIPRQRTAPQPPEPPRLNAATRHLCAGVYVDSTFRDRVLRDVYNDNRRRFAPSYGFDPVPVLRHAWRSWWLETTRDLLITATLVIVLVGRPLIALLVGGLALVWWAGRQLGALTYARWRYLLDRTGRLYGHDLKRHVKVFASLTGAGLVAVATTLAALHAHGQGQPLMRGNLAEAVGALLAPVVLAAGIAAARQFALDRVPDEPERESDQPLPRRPAMVAAAQSHGYTVYGGYRPFIGSGRRVRGWSFVQRLIPPPDVMAQFDRESAARQRPEYATPPFRTDQLVSHLYQQIQSLKEEADPEVRLPGLRVAEHVFIEGRWAARFVPQFEADEPAATHWVMTNPDDAARHYLGCYIESWGGEVFTTVFVHVSLQGRALYLEFSTYALTPTCREFQEIDDIGATGPAARWRAARSSLGRIPELPLAPFRLVRAVRLLAGAARAHRDLTRKARRGVNTGALFSLREEAVWRPDQRENPEDRAARAPEIDYFQLGDINKHSQIIERRLIGAVADFLTTKEVDTSEFWQRATTILNNGVISNGSGNTIVNDSTVGPNATFTTNAYPPQ